MLEFKAAPNKKKHCLTSQYDARALRQMLFQVFCGKTLSEISKFSFIYKTLQFRRDWLEIRRTAN